jgi:DNA-binding NtrC family response regulator
VEIVLPALRDRPDDIPALAVHFVRRAAENLDRPVPTIARDTMDALVAHRWPGNVRELENCLTRAVVLATARVIRPEHLGLHARTDAVAETFPRLEAVEAELVERALVAADGNRTRAAQLLGVSKPRLYRMLLKYGLGS